MSFPASPNGHIPDSPFTLRDYQREAKHASAQSPWQRQLIVLPCGTGKTVLFAHICADVAAAGKRVLILVHRDELIDQTLDKLHVIVPGIPVGVVKAKDNQIDAPIVLASVQTLSRSNRLAQLVPDFRLIIIDEGHHALARTYMDIITYTGGFRPGGPRVIGYTATPMRGDRLNLDAVFQGIVYSRGIREMIALDYLCDVRGLQVTLDMDLDTVAHSHGDFSDEALALAMTRAHAPANIVRGFVRHAPERKAIAFLPSVALAEETARLFNAAGVPAAMVCGATRMDIRKGRLADLRRGQLHVIANCGVLTEGYDDASIDCILGGRPTTSSTLYTQMAGRALRKFPGKEDALILDFAGNTRRHKLRTLTDLVGRHLSSGQSVLEAEEEEREAEKQRKERKGGLAGRTRVWHINLFEQPRLHWASDGTIHVLACGDAYLALMPRFDRRPDGYVPVYLPKEGIGARLAADALPEEDAMGVAEDYARAHHLTSGLNYPNTRWRTQPASPEQIAWHQRKGLPVPESLTQGQASDERALRTVYAIWRQRVLLEPFQLPRKEREH